MQEPVEIADWRRIFVLGSGAFGVVTLWQNKDSSEYLAIKKCKFNSGARLTERQKQRWESEVEFMQNMACPNIVSFKPVPNHFLKELLKYNVTRLPLLSMEYCEKGNLRRELTQVGNLSGLPEADIKVILADVVNAVSYLHARNITHRDIKPDNIVVANCPSRPGNAIYKVIDLGYAKELQDSVVSFVGTLHYLAPEIIKTVKYNHTVDYWSLGVVAFEIVCGTLPFLPLYTPIQRFPFIEKKQPDHICIYQLYSGGVAYSSEILKENHISTCFKRDLEIWLRQVLQFNPDLRGQILPSGLNVFECLLNVLSKKVVTLFCVYTLQFYSYEIIENDTIASLKQLIEQDTKIESNDQILLANWNNFLEITDDRKVFEILPKGDDNVYLFKKSVFTNSENFKLPKCIKLLFENCGKEYKLQDLRQLYIKTLFFLSQEKKLLEYIKTAFYLLKQYIYHLNMKLHNDMNQIYRQVSNMITRVDCYYNLHNSNQKLPPVVSDAYKTHLLQFQHLIMDLEQCIHTANDLLSKVNGLLQRQDTLNAAFVRVEPVINSCDIHQQISRASDLVLKLSENSTTSLTSVDMGKTVSAALKIKDKLLNNKNFRSYCKAILVAIKEVEAEMTWIKGFYENLKGLSKAVDDNQREQYQNLLASMEPKRKAVLKNLDMDKILKENQELRCQFEEVYGQLLLSLKNMKQENTSYDLRNGL